MDANAFGSQPAENSAPPMPTPVSLSWSRWTRCESSFGLLLVPPRPGIFAVAEEVLAPGESAATGGKRLLAVLQFADADDLSRALSRLFTPASTLYDRVAAGRCFVRYAVVEDADHRRAAAIALQDWLAASAEVAAGSAATATSAPQASEANNDIQPPPLPAGF